MNTNPMQMIFQMLSAGNNPNQIIQQAISQNPQAQVVFNQMRNSGMTAEQFTRQYAKQNNINIDSVISSLRNMGFKF